MFNPEVDSSKTFSYTLSNSIDCFALNHSANRIVLAGKCWEILTIDDEQFHFNFFLDKKSINVRIMDIAWSHLDENLIVSCGSNGEINKLVLCEGKLQLDSTFMKFHERTINKINFHPNDPNLLISGGQDGIIKLIDFRCRIDSNPIAKFKHDSEDKVTDLQFNPSPSMINYLASGSENGFTFVKLNVYLECFFLLFFSSESVKIWDWRNPSKYEKKIKTNLNGIHLDWHPEEKYWLATASNDQKIHVWDLQTDKQNLLPINTLIHSESVASIKWRPKCRTQIAACSNHLISHLYVWDLNRPYVPYASFDSHLKQVKNFTWRNSSKVIVAYTFKELHNIHINDAIRPADHSTLITVEMDKHGSVAFAVGIDENKIRKSMLMEEISRSSMSAAEMVYPNMASSGTSVSTTSTNTTINNNTISNSYIPYISESDPGGESNYEKFFITRSALFFDSKLSAVRSDWFQYASENYRFDTGDFEELCDHNAQVALKFNKLNVYTDWTLLKTVYKENDKYETKESLNANNKHLNSNSKLASTLPISNQGLMAPNVNETVQNEIENSLQSANYSLKTLNLHSNLHSSFEPSTNSSRSEDFSSDESLLADANPNLLMEVAGGSKTQPKPNQNSANERLSHMNELYERKNELNMLDRNDEDDDDSDCNPHLYHHNQLAQTTSKFDDEDESGLPSDIIEFVDNNDDFLLDCEQKVNNFMSNFDDRYATNKNTNSLLGNELLADPSACLSTSVIINSLGKNSKIQEYNVADKPSQTTGDLKIQSDIIQNINFYGLNFLYNSNNRAVDEDAIKLNADSFFQQLLFNYINEQNDLPTAVFMFLCATLNKKFDKSKIDSKHLDEWFAQYIELLSKFEFLNLRIKIVKAYQSDLIKNLTLKSINYTVMCSTCKKTMRPSNFVCVNCNKNVFNCALCHMPVKRLYAWCHNCCHGGHMNHWIQWFKNYSKCPTGCGCICANLNFSQN